MEDTVLPTLEQHFGNLTNPRIDRTKLHRPLDILVIAICAVIAGADNWEDVDEFGKARLEWFRTFLELPNGIPSHDTFTRVLARLDPEQFQACFLRWMNAVAEVIGGQVIAIDGKVLRRSHDKGIGKAAIDMVHYSGRFVLLKQKRKLSRKEFAKVSEAAARAFAVLVHGNVRSCV